MGEAMTDPEKPALDERASGASASATPSQHGHAPVVVPDGGLQAWSTVLQLAYPLLHVWIRICIRCLRGLLCAGVPSISWIGSVQFMLPYFLAPFVGQVFDDGGFHKLEIFGGVLFTFSVFMLSLAQPNKYYQVFLAYADVLSSRKSLALKILQAGNRNGARACLDLPPVRPNRLPSLQTPQRSCLRPRIERFLYRRSRFPYHAQVTCLSLLANAIQTLPSHLLPRLGFANTIRASGAIIPPCLLIGNLLMRKEAAHHDICTAALRLPHKTPNPFKHIWAFFVDVPYSWALLASFTGFTGLYFPAVYIQLMSVQRGVDTNLAFYSVTMLNAFGTVFRLLGTHAADRFGPMAVMIGCSFGAGAMIFAMLGLTNSGSLVVISLIYGSFYSTWLALGFPCMASLAKGPEEIGARGGIALAFGSIGTLISAPIQGALLTSEYRWIRPIAFAGSFPNANEAPQYAPVPLAMQQAQWQADLAAGRPQWPVVAHNDPSGPFSSTTPFTFPGSGHLERMEQGSQAAAAPWASAVVGSPMGYSGWWPPVSSSAWYAPVANQQPVQNVANDQQERQGTATVSGTMNATPNVELFPSATNDFWFSIQRVPVPRRRVAGGYETPVVDENRPPSSDFEFAFPAGPNGLAPGPAQQLRPAPTSTQPAPFVDAFNEAGSVGRSLPWWPNDANDDLNALGMQDNVFGPLFAPENGMQD
uniref:MFS general substrate transporter n=1 Tax=Mycena chlorophos TaxID=658473 RepID=A0ABQ0L0U4_MYCCL|nr:predicted protein [Mycena chlorophos]